MKTITIEIPIDELLNSEGDYVIRLRKTGNSQQLTITTTTAATTGAETELETPAASPSFSAYMRQRIDELTRQQRLRTAETHRVALSSLTQFREGADVTLADMTPALMEEYEGWLRQRGLSANSMSFYMRMLRTVYNRAVAAGLTPDRRPFATVYTGSAKTCKRAVEGDVIRQISSMTIADRRTAMARDLFMFSFFSRGMSFVDMAYLRKQDLRDGLLTYRRRKTGQELHMRWNEQLQAIVDRYPSSTDYLLPIISRCNGKERNQYRHAQRWVNEELHTLGERLSLPHVLTMYVARHSWASIARSLNIPVDVISQGMGHNSLKTTQVYLRDIDNGRIDDAHSQIIELLAPKVSAE